MSRNPMDELARRAGQAVRDRAEQVDRHRPDAGGLRRRSRTRSVLLAGAGLVVLLAGLVVFIQARPAAVPVIGDGGGQPSQQPSLAHGKPQAITSRVLVAEGTFEGSDRPWKMYAWLTDDDGVCIELDGTVCGGLATTGQPLGFVGSNTTSAAEQEGCQYGTVSDRVAAVEIVFAGGQTTTLAPIDAGDLPTDSRFFAACWIGDRQPVAVRALDRHGDLLASTDTPPQDDTAQDEPVEPDASWFGPDDRPVTDPRRIRAEPHIIEPGDELQVHFPQSDTRGTGFVVERRTADGWVWEWAVSSNPDATDQNVWSAEEFQRRGVAWESGPAIDGSQPHVIPVPTDTAPGRHRVCTVPHPTFLCAEFEVNTGP